MTTRLAKLMLVTATLMYFIFGVLVSRPKQFRSRTNIFLSRSTRYILFIHLLGQQRNFRVCYTQAICALHNTDAPVGDASLRETSDCTGGVREARTVRNVPNRSTPGTLCEWHMAPPSKASAPRIPCVPQHRTSVRFMNVLTPYRAAND